MSDEEKKVYIIKRVKKVKKGGHHGGSWKIAYADFVTAMMTFFLLMWLLSLLNKYQIAGISEYFRKPLKDAFKFESFEKKMDKADQKPNKIDQKPQHDKTSQGVTSSPNKAPQIDKIQQLQQLKQSLENKLEKDPELRQFKNQLNFIVTADGLKIELRDLKDKPMFSTGKADFEKYASHIVSWLSEQLNTYPNQIVIIGHTDGAQYQGNEYTNWELSADRANATRRVLIKAGMNQEKILRVIGVGDRDLLDVKNPVNPSNRRIEIIVLSNDAMKKMSPPTAPKTTLNATPKAIPTVTPATTPKAIPIVTPAPKSSQASVPMPTPIKENSSAESIKLSLPKVPMSTATVPAAAKVSITVTTPAATKTSSN